jgi:AraC-like DNA-binding protein
MVIAGMTAVHVLGWTGRADPSARAAFFPLSLPLALGPLLYGYVHALAWGRAPDRELLHFLPAAAQFAYLAAVLLTPDPARTTWKEIAHDDVIKPLIEGAVLLSLCGYGVAGLRLLDRYRAWLGRARSDADRYAGRWIGRVLAALLIALAALTAVRLHTWHVGELETGPLQLWLAAWSAWLGVEGWRHSERAFPPMEVEQPSTSALPGHDWHALGERWREATEEGGWWCEPDLTLTELARRLGTNTAYLSRAVNEGLGMNFNAFINRMRAEEVARRLRADPAPRDLLQLALDSGFSSKATFNRAFRAEFGVTPSEFRARLRS